MRRAAQRWLETEEVTLTVADVDAMLNGLEFKNEGLRSRAAEGLLCQARNYVGCRDLFGSLPRGRALDAEIIDAENKLQAARTAVQALPFNAWLSLTCFHEGNQGRPSVTDLLSSVSDLAERLRRLRELRSGQPVRRMPYLALEFTVGAMMLILERATGNRAIARRRPTNQTTNPTLVNAEAEVIGTLLRRTNSKIAVTAIVNKIEKIAARCRGKTSMNSHRCCCAAAAYHSGKKRFCHFIASPKCPLKWFARAARSTP